MTNFNFQILNIDISNILFCKFFGVFFLTFKIICQNLDSSCILYFIICYYILLVLFIMCE